MMQRLIMPFQRQMMLCGYKTAPYRSHWGYDHYGIDVSTIQGGAGDNPTVYASGEGKVLAAGKDNSLGYGLAILYPGAYNHQAGKTQDLVARYMHLRSISVQAGQSVAQGQALGVEGKEGTGDYHLHLEFDADTNPVYAVWSPQVSRGHTLWRKGVDSTINPSYVLHCGPDQVIVPPTYNPAWLNPEDQAIPELPDADYRALYEAAIQRAEQAEAKLDELRDAIRDLVGKYC